MPHPRNRPQKQLICTAWVWDKLESYLPRLQEGIGVNHRCVFGIAVLGLVLATGQTAQGQTAIGATFGDVITLQGSTPSDVVIDELRHVLYLVQNKTNQVIIFDYTTNQVVGSIPTGKTPLAGAISMDGA